MLAHIKEYSSLKGQYPTQRAEQCGQVKWASPGWQNGQNLDVAMMNVCSMQANNQPKIMGHYSYRSTNYSCSRVNNLSG